MFFHSIALSTARHLAQVSMRSGIGILTCWGMATIHRYSVNTLREDFLKKMHSVAYRVTKAECLDLPDITEEVRTVELEPKAMKLYTNLERESYTQMAGSEVSAVNVLTRLLRLSQITGGHLTDDEGDDNAVSTAKLDALSDILDTAMDEGRKLVVVARFIPELNDIQELFGKKGIGYALIRGGVKDRAEEIRRFQEDEDCRVFVGQIAAAGLGITLTAASTMVFYSLDYSMSNFEQAKARIHRVSQKENCLYIYIYISGCEEYSRLQGAQISSREARSGKAVG